MQSIQSLPLSNGNYCSNQENLSINYFNVSRIALEAICSYCVSPQSLPLKILKCSVCIPMFIGLTALSVIIIAATLIYQIALLPTIIPDWSFRSLSLYLHGSLQEAFAYFLVLMTFIIKPKDVLKTNSGIPILMIHGFLHNRSAWIFYKKFFENCGSSIFTLNLGSPFHSIEYFSEIVKRKILKIQEKMQRKDVFIICHSMGGLVATTLSQMTNETEVNIKGLVTLGTPFKGTKAARPQLTPCLKQMHLNSTFTQHLNQWWNTSKIPSLHIASQIDTVVRPYASSLPEKKENVNFRAYKNGGHVSLLISQKVAEQIQLFLGSI